VSITLVFMRGGSRVLTVSMFQWFYRFKVVIKVESTVYGKLTILFLVNYWYLEYRLYGKSCRVSRVL